LSMGPSASGSPAADELPLVFALHLVKHFDVGGFSLNAFFLRGAKGPRRYVHALDDVTLSIRKSETLGLVGESGSGKSTLGRCMLNLLKPDSGTLLFNGEDIYTMKGGKLRALRSRMQVVFQDPYSSLDPSMKVRDIIAEPLIASGRANRMASFERREAVLKMMELVGLNSEYENRFPHEFSGGQRQRIGIARALITSPDFVVFDEPTSALDASIQAQILNLLKRLKAEFRLTSLFITHNMKVVSFMSERIAVMYLGQIVEVGTSEEIIQEPLHPYTKMLIASIPRGDAEAASQSRAEKSKSLAEKSYGEIPSALDPPKGCRFHERCPYVMDKCRTKEPKQVGVSGSRSVACFLYGDAETDANNDSAGLPFLSPRKKAGG
jgi:oligopeptide/dipeptide ABC transporter ATP-binding protein